VAQPDGPAADAAQNEDVRDLVSALGRHWGWLCAFGVLSVLLGVVLLVWPHQTLVVVAAFLGAYLVVSGIFQIVAAFGSSGAAEGFRWLAGLSGFVSLLLGLFAFRSVAHSLAVLVLVIGFGWLIHGLAQLVEAVADPRMPGRGWAIFSGVVGVVAGLVVLMYPSPSLLTLAFLGGIWFVLLGLVQIVGAFRLRSLARSL
jgi:uncharacterized membrane protein HdeD (DUF308 family)